MEQILDFVRCTIPSMLSIGDKIRIARESKKPVWSQYDLADALGVLRTKVSAWELSRSEPKESDLQRVAKVLGIPIAWFRDLDSAAPPQTLTQESPVGPPMALVSHGMRKIRYAGTVPCGEWGDPLNSEEMVEVDAKYEHPKHFATTVAGDSCYPALHHGDMAIWRYDLAPPAGLVVLAQRKGDHGCTVKQLKVDEQGVPHLHPLNPDYSEPENGDGWGVIARLIYVERTTNGAQRMWYSRAGLRPEQLI